MSDLPNVLMITWHDAGRWYHCYGADAVQTPTVDRVAREGVRFVNHFSTCAQCSPARASIMTGTYPQTNDTIYLTHAGWAHNNLSGDPPHLAKILKSAGYRTCLFGIAHEARPETFAELMDYDEQFCGQRTSAHGIADHFRRWLRRQDGDRPLFMQVGFWEAHSPFQAAGGEKDVSGRFHFPPEFTDTPEARQWVAGMQGAMRFSDSAVANLLGSLRDAGLEDDTIVILISDHGADMPRAKMHLFDRGIEVPWILRWPNGPLARGHEVQAMTSHVDVLPTLLDLVGLDPPGRTEGVSLAAHARGEATGEVHEAIFAHIIGTHRCIRTPRHKLIRTFDSEKTFYDPLPIDSTTIEFVPNFPYRDGHKPNYPFVLLYDLLADPNETRDLSGEPAHRATLLDLNRRLYEFLVAVGDPVLDPEEDSEPFYDKKTLRYYREGLADFVAMAESVG